MPQGQRRGRQTGRREGRGTGSLDIKIIIKKPFSIQYILSYSFPSPNSFQIIPTRLSTQFHALSVALCLSVCLSSQNPGKTTKNFKKTDFTKGKLNMSNIPKQNQKPLTMFHQFSFSLQLISLNVVSAMLICVFDIFFHISCLFCCFTLHSKSFPLCYFPIFLLTFLFPATSFPFLRCLSFLLLFLFCII